MKYLPLVALMGLGLVGTAQAACTQANAKGTWMTYQSAFVAPTGQEHVGQCKLVVDKMGSVDGSGSYCNFTPPGTPNLPTGGTVTVTKECGVTIALELGNFSGNGYMTSAKNAWIGSFSAQDGAVSGVTNAVKIKN